MSEPTDDEIAEYGKYALFTEPIVTQQDDRTWQAQNPGADWYVTAETREEAVARLSEESARRHGTGEAGISLWRRHLADPIPGVYAIDKELFLHLRFNAPLAELQAAFRESERRRVLGQTYTKDDYLTEQQNRDRPPPS